MLMASAALQIEPPIVAGANELISGLTEQFERLRAADIVDLDVERAKADFVRYEVNALISVQEFESSQGAFLSALVEAATLSVPVDFRQVLARFDALYAPILENVRRFRNEMAQVRDRAKGVDARLNELAHAAVALVRQFEEMLAAAVRRQHQAIAKAEQLSRKPRFRRTDIVADYTSAIRAVMGEGAIPAPEYEVEDDRVSIVFSVPVPARDLDDSEAVAQRSLQIQRLAARPPASIGRAVVEFIPIE
jgi:hypothetical protein